MSRNGRIFFYRQGFIVFTIMIKSIGTGIMLAFPTILNPAILDPDTADIRATSSDASWIASVLGYAGLAGFFVLPIVLQVHGRKAVHILINTLIAIGWIMFYCAQSLPILYIARAIQGVTAAGIYINVILVGEYTDPARRGYFTALQKALLSFGTLFCHAMTLCLSWRQVALVGFILSVLAAILTLLWPESPFFLAMKGRYEECERSFHWLNGTVARNKELKELIASQKETIENEISKERMSLRRLWKLGSSREFVRAFLIVAILTITIDLCGRHYFKAYIVQIMTELAGSKTTGVYFSIFADCLVITALLLSSFAVKKFRRRKLLFTGGALTVLTLYMTSLAIFLKNRLDVHISYWVSPCLLLFENFIVHFGVTPVAFAIIGEIFPLKLKGLGSCMSGIVLTASYGTVIKLTPVLMENLGIEVAFVIYGTGLIVCFLVLHFILPETKDKTLLEIENKLKGNTKRICENESVLLNAVC